MAAFSDGTSYHIGAKYCQAASFFSLSLLCWPLCNLVWETTQWSGTISLMLSIKILAAEDPKPRTTTTSVYFQRQRKVSSAAKPRASPAFPAIGSWGEVHQTCIFQEQGCCEQKGCYGCVPAKAEDGHCLADPWWWTKAALSILLFLFFQGCLGAVDLPDGSRLAGLEDCCCSLLQQERMGSGLCLARSLHRPGRTLSRPTQLGSSLQQDCEGSGRQKWLLPVSLVGSACLCSSCLPSMWACWRSGGSGQSHRHLPLEHFGSGELDLPALLPVKRVLLPAVGQMLEPSGSVQKGLVACLMHAGGVFSSLLRDGAAVS